MKKLAFVLGIGFLFLLMGQVNAYTQDLYYYNVTTDTDFSMSAYNNVSSDIEVCNTTIQTFADIIGGAGKNVQFFLYNNGTQVGVPFIYSSNANATCLTIANQVISGAYLNITARAVNLGSPVTTTLFLEMHTNCGQNNNATVFVTSNNPTLSLNQGWNMYQQHYQSATIANVTTDVVNVWNNVTPAHCQLTNKEIPSVVSIPTGNGVFWFVPFNSGLGFVNISLSQTTNALSYTAVGLMNLDSNTATLLNSGASGSTVDHTFSGNLIPATDYVAWVVEIQSVGAGGFRPPLINITLTDYVANYNCNATACINGTRTLTCTDIGGIAPTTITQQSCLAVNETVVLGFENYYFPFDRYICQPIWYPLCGIQGFEGLGALANISVLFPDNPRWTIIPNTPLFYSATITSEAATLGSRSLKLWYVPPSAYNDQPIYQVIGNTTSVICHNTTLGEFTESRIGINSTFMATMDFTFPSDTMQLKFDFKKCASNVVQYNSWCGLRCYSQNCSTPPTGWFTFALYDPVTNTNIFEYSGEATNNWTTITAELGSNVIQDQNYTMIITVLPLPWNPTTGYGNCVYFDNVRLFNQEISTYDEWAVDIYNQSWSDLSETEKQTVLNQKCIDGCIGNDYYDRTIQELTCLEIITLNDSTCVVQYQQQQIGNQSIFLPISSIGNTIINTTTNQTLAQSLQAQGFGFTLLFLTPIFWIMMIVVVVMGALAYWTRHMEIGVASGIIMMIVMASVFPELIWITIVVVIIAGYIIGRQVIRAVQG